MPKGENAGNIVNVGSVASQRPVQGGLIYCTAKGATEQLTRCLALELGTKYKVQEVIWFWL